MGAGDEARVVIPFVGLTGGIGAGKSEALAALERLGAATLSSDAVVHEILTTGEARAALVERLGHEVAPGGEVDRGAVARAVFGDPEAREGLPGDPLAPRGAAEPPGGGGWGGGSLGRGGGRRTAGWGGGPAAGEPRPRAAIVEVPLLFESG